MKKNNMNILIILCVFFTLCLSCHKSSTKEQNVIKEENKAAYTVPSMKRPQSVEDFEKKMYTYRSDSGYCLKLFIDENKFELTTKETVSKGNWIGVKNKIICTDSLTNHLTKFYVVDDLKLKVIHSDDYNLASNEIMYLITITSNTTILELMDWKNGERDGMWISRNVEGQQARLYDKGVLKKETFSTWEEWYSEPAKDIITIYKNSIDSSTLR